MTSTKSGRPVMAFVVLSFLVLFLSEARVVHAQDASPVVRCVLFYSPTCPHCQHVISETLPPLVKKHGNQLEIFFVDVTQPRGRALFVTVLQEFGLEGAGVPFLVIDDIHLIGSQEIPEKLPGLIETYLSRGGTDWPDIPGVQEALSPGTESSNPPSHDQPAAAASEPAIGAQSSDWTDRFASDPAGNTLAVVTLAGMLVATGYGAYVFMKRPGVPLSGQPARVIPVLCATGCVIAGYLAYLEISHAEAVCGPVGHCDVVQHSEYARLFGVLPIGLLGVAGYVAILVAWSLGRTGRSGWSDPAGLILLAMTASGTLFSIYLTFLEPFVIGATCLWCLSSAILMTVLMLLSIEPGKLAFTHLFKKIPPPGASGWFKARVRE